MTWNKQKPKQKKLTLIGLASPQVHSGRGVRAVPEPGVLAVGGHPQVIVQDQERSLRRGIIRDNYLLISI